jgi:hypothetical protein
MMPLMARRLAKRERVLLLSAVPLFHFPEHRVGDETAAIDLEPKALGRPTSGAVDGNPCLRAGSPPWPLAADDQSASTAT